MRLKNSQAMQLPLSSYSNERLFSGAISTRQAFSKQYCLLILCFLLLLTTVNGQQKTVCFTVDDLPVVAYGVTDTAIQGAITRNMVLGMQRNGIPAVGFVNAGKVFESETHSRFRTDLLRYWLRHGMLLGNHTYSHPDYNKVTLQQFGKDVLRGETLPRELMAEHGMELRYFRHPYLRVGQTRERADSLERFLEKHGYIVAPVTMDNDDYLFASAYAKAVIQGDTGLREKIGSDYLAYLDQKINWYEGASDRLFGRQIAQIFLFHASKLNADYIEELISAFRRKGYRFLSLEEALKDPVYSTEIKVFGKYGSSWLDRWALSAGKTKEFFSGEPEVPAYIARP